MMKHNQPTIDMLRKLIPSQIAAELVSVQPMNVDLSPLLEDNGPTEQELRAAGYEPVDELTRLLWMKK